MVRRKRQRTLGQLTHTTHRTVARATTVGVLAMALLLSSLLPATVGTAAAAGAVQRLDGCTTNTLPRNDDGSTGAVPIGFPVDFFGSQTSQLYVNNNGNVTFDGALSSYTPAGLTSAMTTTIIAPFWADVDTRGSGSAEVTYGQTTVGGQPAFCVLWDGVGYYGSYYDKLNVFQLLLIASPTGVGDFDIHFNYDQIQWETGDASNGTNGFGGDSAGAGFTAGTGVAGTYYELPGSRVNGAFLDSNLTTGLIHRSSGTPVLGSYRFAVRGGAPIVESVAGSVVDQAGAPISGATVSLHHRLQEGEPFVLVPSDGDVLIPSGTPNPRTTTADGRFSWTTSPGTYLVRAAAPGCTAPGGTAASVESEEVVVPPGAQGIRLALSCTAAPYVPPPVTPDIPVTPDVPEPPAGPKVPTCRGVTAPPFPDVPATYHHARAIECATGLGLMEGFVDGTFGTHGLLTRGQMASMVLRALEISEIELEHEFTGFTDLEGNVHAEAIRKLARAGILEGRTETLFAPQQWTTRAQMMAILDRVSTELLLPLPDVAEHRFLDDGDSVHWRAIARMHDIGVARGYRTWPDYFVPAAPVTRAQAASIITRWIEWQYESLA
jgi:hypothetical protein